MNLGKAFSPVFRFSSSRPALAMEAHQIFLLCSFLLALAAAVAAENKIHPSALPLEFRSRAQLWPCEDPEGCPLSARFAKDDPRGDAFLDKHVVWVVVRNETSQKAKSEHQRLCHSMEPWIRNLQPRKVLFLSIVCENAEDKVCRNISPDHVYVFHKRAFTMSYHVEEIFDAPTEIILDSLRAAYNLPHPGHREQISSLIRIPDLPRKYHHFFVLQNGISNQETFFAVELGGFLRQFGIPVVPGDSEILDEIPEIGTAGVSVFDSSEQSGCDFNSLKNCKFIRNIETTSSTVEETACEIFLSKQSSRKIHLSDHKPWFVRSLLQICPVVVIINEHLAQSLPTKAIDEALERHKDAKLVTIMFDSTSEVKGIEAVESMSKSHNPATIFVQKDRWSERESHALEVWSPEAFRHSLEDKVAIYSFLRSARPDTTYLRMKPGDDALFTLSNDEVQAALDKNGLGKKAAAKHITGKKQFSLAISQRFVIVHFYQMWNPACFAVHEALLRARLIFKERYMNVGIPFTSINCFKDDTICEELGVKSYPTLIMFSRGVAIGIFSETVTLKNLLRPAALSIPKKRKKIINEERWQAVSEDFSPLLDLIFVGVDLSADVKESFTAAAKVLNYKDLLIEASRTALPSEIQKALPEEPGSIFAFNPKLNSVEGILSKKVSEEEILQFVRTSKLFVFTELTMDGVIEIQTAAKPLLIAFARALDPDLTMTLFGVTKAFRGHVVVRWMNASMVDTVAVMQAYNITHTPSLLLKMNEEIFPFSGPQLQADAIGAWINDVTGKKISSQYSLKEMEHRALNQYLDHLGKIFDSEEKKMDEQNDDFMMAQGKMRSRPKAHMKDEL